MFRHLGMHHCSLSLASLILATITVCTSSYIRQPLLAAALARYQTAPANPVAISDESVAGGLNVYTRFCRSCHGTGGVGDGPGAPPDVMPPSLIDAECFEGCADGDAFDRAGCGDHLLLANADLYRRGCRQGRGIGRSQGTTEHGQ